MEILRHNPRYLKYNITHVKDGIDIPKLIPHKSQALLEAKNLGIAYICSVQERNKKQDGELWQHIAVKLRHHAFLHYRINVNFVYHHA